MYINSVISSLGAWRNVEQDYPFILQDLQSLLSAIDREQLPKEARRYVSPRRISNDARQTDTKYLISPNDLNKDITQGLSERGWKTNVRLLRSANKYSRLMTIDATKGQVGLELGLGKGAFLESRLFVGFPYLIQGNLFRIAVILVPMASLARHFSIGVNSFEAISEMLTEMRPLPLKYPFVIIGFSDNDSSLEVIELTSELDNFLLNTVGLSLYQMALLNERPNYDFKLKLPENKKLAQEICAFANLSGGGLILLGIDKDGLLIGVTRGKSLDDIQLQITNIIHDCCTPRPKFDIHIFDNPENHSLSILVIRVYELERKPCMTQEKVYVRSGPSARAAGPDEIRRLILG